MKNGIVIPCYNEANRLKFYEFENFLDNNPNYLLCFVNDGSSDATLSQLLDFQAVQNERVLVVNLTQNSGKAEAVRQGVQELLDHTKVQTLGYLDADLAAGFDDYKRLVQIMRVAKKNLVFGSRKLAEDQDIKRSRFRKMASSVLGSFISKIIGMPVKDTQCGAKVFRRSTAAYVFSKGFMSRWLFDVEIFIRLQRLYEEQVMARVSEVALLSWNEVEGSKITLLDSLKFPLQLLEIGYGYRMKPEYMPAFINESYATTSPLKGIG